MCGRCSGTMAATAIGASSTWWQPRGARSASFLHVRRAGQLDPDADDAPVHGIGYSVTAMVVASRSQPMATERAGRRGPARDTGGKGGVMAAAGGYRL